MDLELGELRAFVALADDLHFGRAARRLHISQPALSKQIRKLEEKIGGPLLVRQYRRPELTAAGRVLLNRARTLLRESSAALDVSRRAARGEAGLLRVGLGIAIILDVLPAVLLPFRRACPEVELRMRDMSTPDQVSALLRNELDVGFVRLPVEDRALATRRLMRERLVVALGPGSSWNASERLASLAKAPFIVCAPAASESFYTHVLRVCASAGFAPRVVQETGEVFTMLSLVRAGIGVALVPSSAARVMRMPGVRFRELKLPEAEWEIGLAWREGEDDPLVRTFVEIAASRGDLTRPDASATIPDAPLRSRS